MLKNFKFYIFIHILIRRFSFELSLVVLPNAAQTPTNAETECLFLARSLPLSSRVAVSSSPAWGNPKNAPITCPVLCSFWVNLGCCWTPVQGSLSMTMSDQNGTEACLYNKVAPAGIQQHQAKICTATILSSDFVAIKCTNKTQTCGFT